MNNIAAVVILVAVGLLINSLGDILGKIDDGKRAMTVCQLSHSHDVCFQALNR